MGSVYPAALSHFAVFCPSLGPDEDTAHEQLLFYAAATLPAFYPYSANDYYARNVHLRRQSSGSNTVAETSTGTLPISSSTGGRRGGSRSPTNRIIATSNKAEDNTTTAVSRERVVSLDMKLREIGLGAALLAFAGTFGADSRQFHVVHSEKRRTLLFQPEPGVLIQLSVVLPRRVRPYGKEKDAYTIEFLDSQIADGALEAWLRQEYWAFRMLFGPIGRVMRKRSMGVRQVVKRQLDLFFGKTMWAWDSRWDPKIGSELDLLHSLLPLPQLPLGSISLGGFEEFWRDLSMLSTERRAPDGELPAGPLVHDAVVLWRGREIVWSSWILSDSAEPSEKGQAEDRVHLLRALVSWSRAVYAPVFEVAPTNKTGDVRGRVRQTPMSPPSRPMSALSAGSSRVAERAASHSLTASGGWGAFPGSSWLWGWGGGGGAQQTTHPHRSDAASSGECTDSNRSSADGNRPTSPTNNVMGISQALSRAVNLLVEPRPPTPPEEDPVFASADLPPPPVQEIANNPDQYVITASDIDASGTRGAMLVRDSDVESLWSVGSLASVKTTRTTAAPAIGMSTRTLAQRSSVGRVRSSTIQQGNVIGGGTSVPSYSFLSRPLPQPPHLGRHSRTPSGASSIGTAASTQLRDDTRVSLRSWWPTAWSWKSTNEEEEEEAEEHPSPLAAEVHYASPQSSSGINMDSTFLFTGEHPFPGARAPSQERVDSGQVPPAGGNRAKHILVKNTEEEEESTNAEESHHNQQTIDQLGLAMDEELPAVYEHGAGVDASRGVVLAPRAVEGMLYDTRLVRLLYGDESADAGNRVYHEQQQRSGAMAEMPLFFSCTSSSSRQKEGSLPCDHPMHAARTPVQKQKHQMVGDIAARCSRTLAYKYGDMLYIVFGAPRGNCADSVSDKSKGKQAAEEEEPISESSIVDASSSRRGRRARKERRRKAAASSNNDGFHIDNGGSPAEGNVRFSTNEALAIEGAILRYAESLQAATERDVGEIHAQRQKEVQLAKQRRIPPYMYHKEAGEEEEDGHVRRLTTTLTNWQRQDVLPVNRSFQGLVDGDGSNKQEVKGDSSLSLLMQPENVRTALSAVNAELLKHRENGDDVSLCVRMQDKGWVTAQHHQRRQEQSFCVVDQQNATLADAHSFLSRISKRARSLDASR
ncbi:hypothetical protein EV175_000142 [Coemansia sp. RSA 1933]|nr:hypothetical protein EV175_000142 [Coemansia sp. RSA 1933]